MEEIEDAPEEITRLEGEDAAEKLRTQEIESKKRLASELKTKRRKQNEANRKSQQEKEKKKSKKRNEDESDLNELASKKSGFLDASVVDFLVEKERKEGTDVTTAPVAPTKPKVSIRKRKKKLSSYTLNDRTKLVVLNEKSPHTREGTEFWHKKLHASRNRSLEMLKPKPSIKKRRLTR